MRDDVEIARLLEQSRVCHEQAKECRRQKDLAGNWEALAGARTLRQQAHALDPDHRSPAWDEGPKYQHAALMDFYARQFGRL